VNGGIVEPTIVQSKLVLPFDKQRQSLDDLLRSAVRAIGTHDGARFTPEGKRDRAFIEGAVANHDRVTLVHPKFSESAGYENSWLSVTVDTYEPKPLAAIFLGIHMGRPGEQLSVEWTIGLEVMPRLVEALNPTLAFMTAKLVDVERKIFPPEEPIAGTTLPRRFTPWTYFLVDRLTGGTRRKLSALPAATSKPLSRGWLVQAVEHVDESAPPSFLKALNTLTDAPIDYLEPILQID
jgi:hypothetical protein